MLGFAQIGVVRRHNRQRNVERSASKIVCGNVLRRRVGRNGPNNRI
jgi:hypothetical protein